MISDLFTGGQVSLLLSKIMFVALGASGIGIIIAIHEFGHFIFGKLFKVNIPSFSIGFGPKIASWRSGGTDFSISLIPIGGYVEAECGSYDHPVPGSIAALPYWKKLIIIGGGIFFNFVFSYLIFTGLFLSGLPSNPLFPSQKNFFIYSIENDSPAARMGLQAQDVITSIDNQPVSNNLPALLEYIQKHPNATITISATRNDSPISLTGVLGAKKDGSQEIGFLGAQFNFGKGAPLSLLASLKESYFLILKVFKSSLFALTKSVRNKETKGFAGPLMMVKMTAQSASQGIEIFLFLLAYISIGIAVLNIIPLPIFDGGQALTYTIEAIIQRPIGEKILNIIHLLCWILMLGLFVLLTYQDILRLFCK